MENIENLRKQIDEIDKQMAILFEKRMNIVKDIYHQKQIASLSVCDPEREKQLIENNLSYIKDENIKKLYLELIQKELELSKQYQELLAKK